MAPSLPHPDPKLPDPNSQGQRKGESETLQLYYSPLAETLAKMLFPHAPERDLSAWPETGEEAATSAANRLALLTGNLIRLNVDQNTWKSHLTQKERHLYELMNLMQCC
ncbi:hypothetical protein CGCF415_v003015 [Colletotrichum fructicola]|uniref:Uncharacterized protein n=1 Tax=Colletotrichum fructicola (strain Nara gc5) TaxID=1213859 RepID=A0A7J6IZE5_COLFN|nr:uncharacterized protein CGMCC3_g13933 [Colletotrichum fructicola]KAF4482632.1 hypothetical protein CGGC5_v009550 [Colletotrichum fructicola Nara gc5]KAE9569921.1 hypothetical protein CGMCC3_g13933 [Colletotrichum fructicola]KAF4418252.1 hypothetical protein CFRS1_v008317 [Colletotrichum fructicola]KAF4899359.1 hypothetical protein CGCFRS4_v003859 [Colletotrichum fructicola]KAF4913460.1 hypothetical protein CGCF415_v003015 [Colletotrichum fructicola]